MSKTTTAVWQPSATFLFKISVITSAVTGLGVMTGCTASPTSAKTQKSNQLGMLDASSLDSLEDLLSATDMRAVEGDRLLILKHGDVWKRMTVGFKMDETKWDPRIDAQRSWFITRQPYLDRLSARASRYLYHTVKEAERRGLPTELALLPVIESSYDPAATSSAAAAGMWQFIPSTGRIYGLRQTNLYDGRRDVVESTRAAYEFLGSLYNQFGSWELALAAYNAGPGRIQQAINRNKAAGLPTDYWSLRLPQETMNYVPRFLAVAQIIKSPEKYGVRLPPIANRPHFREVPVPAGASLNEIASLTGLSRAELYQLNPGHRGDIIDPQSPQRILIPADLNPNIDRKLKALKPSSTGLWASASSPVSTSTPATTITTTVNTPKASNASVLATQTAKPVNNTQTPSVSTTISTSKGRTPSGSDALAAFAASAVVPSAPRIPVAVTPAQNVKPVRVEPEITAEEKAKILASIAPEKTTTTTSSDQIIASVIEPQATEAEKAEVVREISAIAPQGTEIVDPLDGKIKLTAIQTSQSVAAGQGSEVKVGFAYPKSVAESTLPTSEEAQLNQGKAFKKTESEVVVEPPKGKRSTYTVLPGDTLAIIAMKNGVSWRDIAKWNQVDPNATLYVGATLYLYDAKPVASAQKTDVKPASYIVKANDSLTSVANQFDLSVQQLAELNGLTINSNLLVGQKLNLTQSQASKSSKTEQALTKVQTKSYTVKRGEYLKLIADRYGLSTQELASLSSGLKAASSLYAGQKINVPLEEVQSATASSTTRASNAKTVPEIQTETYRVQRGDTLYNIANANKLTVVELATLNNLDIEKGLMVGQTIKVPVGSKVPEQYVVQSGDSLNAIASKYNLSVAQLAEMNGLRTNAGLQVGQKLNLKEDENKASTKQSLTRNNSVAEKVESHTVKSGETLASIARQYDMSLQSLLTLNDLNARSVLQIGQKLKVSGDVEKAAASTEKTPIRQSKSRDTEDYAVKSGESLHVIATRFDMTAKELADLNKLNLRTGLQRGQIIQVPKVVTDYKVRSGDSLYRIANRFGIDIDQLAEMNGLKPNTPLQIGATIKVPHS